jgi:sirohydrochlorin ferrochelatase
MNGPTTKDFGIILVDHGSRRAESNSMLPQVANQLKADTGWSIVEPAHMEIAEPTIEQAFDRCVEQGAELIVVHPFFVGPGRHSTEHIPEIVEQAASRHNEIDYRITPPLGPDSLLIEIVKQRVDSALDQ